MDVQKAFLQRILEGEILMDQPEGFMSTTNVCKLLQTLNELKQMKKQMWQLFDVGAFFLAASRPAKRDPVLCQTHSLQALFRVHAASLAHSQLARSPLLSALVRPVTSSIRAWSEMSTSSPVARVSTTLNFVREACLNYNSSSSSLSSCNLRPTLCCPKWVPLSPAQPPVLFHSWFSSQVLNLPCFFIPLKKTIWLNMKPAYSAKCANPSLTSYFRCVPISLE